MKISLALLTFVVLFGGSVYILCMLGSWWLSACEPSSRCRFFRITIWLVATQNVFRFIKEMKLKSVCSSFWIFKHARMLRKWKNVLSGCESESDLFVLSQFTCYWSSSKWGANILCCEKSFSRLLFFWSVCRWCETCATAEVRALEQRDVTYRTFGISRLLNLSSNSGTFWTGSRLITLW